MKNRTLHGTPSGSSAGAMPSGRRAAAAWSGRMTFSQSADQRPSTTHTGVPSTSPGSAEMNRNHCRSVPIDRCRPPR
jgi:hypothetical protein